MLSQRVFTMSQDYYCEALRRIVSLPGSDLRREVIAIVKDGSVHLVEDTRAFPSLYTKVKAFTYSGVVFRFVFEM